MSEDTYNSNNGEDKQDRKEDFLKGIHNTLQNLENKIDKQNEKIETLENKIATLEEYEPKPTEAEPPPPPPPEPFEKVAAVREAVGETMEKLTGINKFIADKKPKEAPAVEPAPEDEREVAVPPPSKEEIKEVTDSLEERIGGKLFARVGIVALVLGAAFFLKYAFDNDWIGETGRVIIGVFGGLSLLALGEKTIRKYFFYGQIVSGGGIAILYLSVYAAFNFYHLIGQMPTFAFMALVTAVGIALSLRYNAPSLIIVSTLGGFATPFLISSGTNQQISLFSYIILLDLAVLIVSIFKKWRWLNVIGFLGTIIVFTAWFDHFYTTDQLLSTFLFLTIFFVIFSISSLAYNLYRKEKSTGVEQVLTLFSGIIYFLFSYSLLNADYHSIMGLFTMMLAVYYFLWAYLVRLMTPEDKNLYQFLAFLCVSFVTLAIPIQFSKFIITIAWAIEATLLVFLATRVGGRNAEVINLFGLVIFALAIGRTLFIDYQLYKISDQLFINKVFWASFVVTSGLYLAAYFYNFYADELNKDTRLNPVKLTTVLTLIASALFVFSVSRDLNKYYDYKIDREYNRVNQENQEIRELHGNIREYMVNVDSDKIHNYRELRHTTIGAFWLLFGALLIAWGSMRKMHYLLVFGTIITMIAILKVFFFDLWNLDTWQRPFMATLAVLTAYGGAGWYWHLSKNESEHAHLQTLKLMTLFLVAANALTITAISREIYLYFDARVDELQNTLRNSCRMVYSKFKDFIVDGGNQISEAECNNLKKRVDRLESWTSIAISLFWMFYALILVVLGFVKRFKWVRIGGILLLIISIIKLFFLDLWSLGQLYRIIASISLGAVLLGISFLYQKYKHIFKEIIND